MMLLKNVASGLHLDFKGRGRGSREEVGWGRGDGTLKAGRGGGEGGDWRRNFYARKPDY